MRWSLLVIPLALAGCGKAPPAEMSCPTRLRLVAMGVLAYAELHDETLPPSAWMDATFEYIGSKELYTCPHLNDAALYGHAMDASAIATKMKSGNYAYMRPLLFDSKLPTWNAVANSTSMRFTDRPQVGSSCAVAFQDGSVRVISEGQAAQEFKNSAGGK